MKYIYALILLLLAGCTSSLCVENLDLGAETLTDYNNPPSLDGYTKVIDRSVSVGGEIHDLIIYQASEDYYVEYQPRSQFRTTIYGPFNGTAQEDLACE